MKPKKIVVRRSSSGNFAFIAISVGFVAFGIYLLQEGLVGIGLMLIVLCGGTGLLWLVFKSWRPVMIISDTGITIPFWRGKTHVLWENVMEIRMVEKTFTADYGIEHAVEYIGIFVHDATGIPGTSSFFVHDKTAISMTSGLFSGLSRKLIQGTTGLDENVWSEIAQSKKQALLIDINYNFDEGKEEECIQLLQEFHNAYLRENLSEREVSQTWS
jgi:hypothetical protein